MYNDYLMHYGRLGMKWGQHIFGRKRSNGTKRTKTQKPQKLSLRKRRALMRLQEEQNRAMARRKEILSSPTKLYKHRNEFTEKEIRDAINKFKWEKELRDLSQNEVSKGQKFIDRVIKVEGKVANLLNTTKTLNKATGGLLFGYVDKQLKNNDVYKSVKGEIDNILKDVKDKEIFETARREAAKEVAKEKLKNKK